MRNILSVYTVVIMILCSCESKTAARNTATSTSPLVGTWKLLSGTLIEKGDTVVTDYTKDKSFIKIINETHFAFLQHDLKKGVDSMPVFGAGGGSYSLAGDKYTEHLEYCNARNWEGHNFQFDIKISGDTLVQSGVEKIESEGIDRMNIERYVRVSN